MSHRQGYPPAAEPTLEQVAYTIRQFCAAFGVSRSFAYAEIKAGRLRRTKLGPKKVIITRVDALHWLEQRRAEQESPLGQSGASAPTVVSDEGQLVHQRGRPRKHAPRALGGPVAP